MVATSTLAAFEAFLATVQLNEALEARAAIGRALARQLDEADTSRLAGTAVQAIPSMAKELRAVIDEIQERSQGDDEFLNAVFGSDGEVGDTTD